MPNRRNWFGERIEELSLLWSPRPWQRGSVFLGLLFHPGIWLPLLLIHLVVIWWAGRKVGAPLLFWNDNWLYALLAGITTTLFLAAGVFVFFLLDFTSQKDEHGSHWSDDLLNRFRENEGQETSKNWLQLSSFIYIKLFNAMALLMGLILIIRAIIIWLFWLLPNPARQLKGDDDYLLQIADFTTQSQTARLHDPNWWMFPLGLLTGWGVVLLLNTFRRRVIIPKFGSQPEGSRNKYIWALWGYGLVTLLLIHLFVLLIGEWGNTWLAAPALCISLGWVFLIYAAVVLLLRLPSLEAIAYVIVAILILPFVAGYFMENERYEYRDLPEGENWPSIRVTDNRLAEEATTASSIYPESVGPANWNSQNRPLVVVCVSGGGITAEVWAIDVLTMLSAELEQFADSVRIVTGASGGMVGAAAWVEKQAWFTEEEASRPFDYDPNELVKILSPAHSDTPFKPDNWHLKRAKLFFEEKKLRQGCRTDQLSPVAHRWTLFDMTLFGTVVQHFGWMRYSDRGNVLEDVWRRSENLPGLGRNLGHLAEQERTGNCPSLIFTPVVAEEGRRLLISNLNLQRITSNFGSDNPNAKTVFNDSIHSGIEAQSIFDFSQFQQVPLSHWARMSATFPVVTPGGAMYFQPLGDRKGSGARMDEGYDGEYRERQTVHIVDAGYFDNYGTFTALSWLSEYWLPWVASSNSSAPRKVIMIEVDAYPRYENETGWGYPYRNYGKKPKGLGQLFFEDFSIPASTLAKRSTIDGFQNDQATEHFIQTLRLLKQIDPVQFSDVDFRRYRFVNPVPSSLSWTLSDQEEELLFLSREALASVDTNPLLPEPDDDEKWAIRMMKYKGRSRYNVFSEWQMAKLKSYWDQSILPSISTPE